MQKSNISTVAEKTASFVFRMILHSRRVDLLAFLMVILKKNYFLIRKHEEWSMSVYMKYKINEACFPCTTICNAYVYY